MKHNVNIMISRGRYDYAKVGVPLDFEDQEGDWFQDRIRPFTSLIDYIIAYSVS